MLLRHKLYPARTLLRSFGGEQRKVEHPPWAAGARQPLLGVACAVSIDQYTCITEKRYAVLTPNSSIPSTASSAPIICQGRCSVSPDAPRVLIESSEKNKASVNEPRAPSHKYAVTS